MDMLNQKNLNFQDAQWVAFCIYILIQLKSLCASVHIYALEAAKEVLTPETLR